jgi:hypothetical protein
MLCSAGVSAQQPAPAAAPAVSQMTPLTLGFAVDTTATPANWWGVDPARAVLPDVVRFWRDYLIIRHDSLKRRGHWVPDNAETGVDADPVPVVAPYLLSARPQLVEALPAQSGNPSRWILRTIYATGPAMQPAYMAFERSHIVGVRDGQGSWQWKLEDPAVTETVNWPRHRIGLLHYVVHPSIAFNADKAHATARWVDSTLQRFGLEPPGPITYYQVPDLEAGFRISGFQWLLGADRVGGRASSMSATVLAADPRYGEAYLHEISHVLLAPLVSGRSTFVVEGLAYWLGGARGSDFVGMIRSGSTFLIRNPNITLDEIFSNRAQSAAASMGLPVAASFFELIHRRGGDRAVLDVIEKLGTGEPTMDRLAQAVGISTSEMIAQWQQLLLQYTR